LLAEALAQLHGGDEFPVVHQARQMMNELAG
jgi:hypothetical protein